MYLRRLIPTLTLFLITCPAAQADVSALSAKLAHCKQVYSYVMQSFQAEGNIKGADNMALRYSRVTASYLWLNEKDGKLPGDAVAQFLAKEDGLVEQLHADKMIALRAAYDCESVTEEAWELTTAMNKTIRNRTLLQEQEETLALTRQTLGL